MACFNLQLNRTESSLIVVQSKWLVNLIKHLAYFKANLVISWIQFQNSLIQSKSFIDFTLEAFYFCEKSDSFETILVFVVFEDDSEVVDNGCVVSVQIMNFG